MQVLPMEDTKYKLYDFRDHLKPAMWEFLLIEQVMTLFEMLSKCKMPFGRILLGNLLSLLLGRISHIAVWGMSPIAYGVAYAIRTAKHA